MIEVHLMHFEQITGINFDIFTNRIFKGDGWGIFLKITSILETSVKRALALKLELPPDHKYIGKLEFMNLLHICKDLNMITKEPFNFVTKIIEVRNKLAHTNGQLTLDIQQLQGEKFFIEYRKHISNYINIEDQDIIQGEKQHMNYLLIGCIGFIGEIADSLFGDNWLKNVQATNR